MPATSANNVVAAAADAVACVEVGTALPDDDLAGVDQLAAEPLDAEPLRIGVPTVSGRGRAFLCAMSSPQLLISVTKTLVYR